MSNITHIESEKQLENAQVGYETLYIAPLPNELKNAPSKVHDLFWSLTPVVSGQQLEALFELGSGVMNNKRKEGTAPENGFKIGKKIMYSRLDVALWVWDSMENNKPKSQKKMSTLHSLTNGD